MKSLEIDLQALPFGRSELVLEVPASELDIDEDYFRFHRSLTVELEVVKREREIVLSGWVTGRAQAECSRCLAAIEEAARAPLSLTCHIERGEDLPADGEAGGAISRFISAATTRLDLTDDVRSALILELPVQPLCREDCRGLCPRCGQDLNQGGCACPASPKDDRWKALEGLRRSGE